MKKLFTLFLILTQLSLTAQQDVYQFNHLNVFAYQGDMQNSEEAYYKSISSSNTRGYFILDSLNATGEFGEITQAGIEILELTELKKLQEDDKIVYEGVIRLTNVNFRIEISIDPYKPSKWLINRRQQDRKWQKIVIFH